VGELDVAATLRAAALRRGTSVEPTPGVPPDADRGALVRREDVRRTLRQRARAGLVVFVLDASDSMGAHARMSAAKGAALALLSRAYLRRDRVALVSFEGEGAAVVLAPTRSVARASARLRQLPTGGATPLGDGMRLGWQLVRNERLKDRHLAPLLVLVSDGEANVPLMAGHDVWRELAALGRAVSRDGVRCLVIDAGLMPAGGSAARRIAELFGGTHQRIERWQATELAAAVGAAQRAERGGSGSRLLEITPTGG
jgi:Mg-chelatase subunit ChlD